MVTPSLPCSWIVFCSTVTPGDLSRRSIKVAPFFPGKDSALTTVRSMSSSVGGRFPTTVAAFNVFGRSVSCRGRIFRPGRVSCRGVVSLFRLAESVWACAQVRAKDSQAATIAVDARFIVLGFNRAYLSVPCVQLQPGPLVGSNLFLYRWKTSGLCRTPFRMNSFSLMVK